MPASPLPDIPALAARGGVFALGNFDGVHLGHRAVIRAAVERARGLGIPARVLTLEPHPRSLFKPGIAPFRLTPAAAKERLLRHLGVDDVLALPFTRAFSQLPPPAFVEDVLLGLCGARHVIAGFDFVFGRDRGGDMAKLREWLSPHGVDVTEITPFRDSHGEIMSSSRTREALQAGDLATAAHILGRPWSIAGVVAHGDRRGTGIGVPTANIALGDYLRPRYGVYAVLAGPVGAVPKFQGVANIGVRPTVDGATEWLEAHLFDFDRDIYGQEWEVELIAFLREEAKFDGIPALRRQIALDIVAAKAVFAQNAALR